jgi:hypothetical protein
MSKYHFKEGEIVCHKENLSLDMTVARILKESREFNKGFDAKENKPIIERGIRMIGIEVHWWEVSESEPNKKNLRTHKFHSSELIPKEIAKEGIEIVNQWITDQVK